MHKKKHEEEIDQPIEEEELVPKAA